MTETYTSDFVRTFVDDGVNILFSGTGDTGDIARAGGDTITTIGTDQTVNLSITGDLMTIVDQGSGLNLGIGENVTAVSVQGFQNDPTGHVTLRLASATPSLAPDGSGGTLLTVKNDGGVLAGAQIDFVGDPAVTTAQISGGDPPPPTTPPNGVQFTTINIADSSGDAGITNDNSDIVNFSGISDALAFSHSIGSTFITSGTNQTLAVDFAGQDDAITDLGQGLTLSFFALTGAGLEISSSLIVRGFESDATGRVIVKTDVGQTASLQPDAKGGTRLTLSGQYGGTVDFAGDPMANLAAHLVTNV